MTMVLGFLLIFGLRVTGKPLDGVDPQVVGGTVAEDGTFPGLVSIRNVLGAYCGGSIVSKNYILTAAHCTLMEPESITVGYGSVRLDDQKLVRIEKILRHPKWDFETLAHDIALMKLRTPLNFTKTVQPLKHDYDKDLDNRRVTAAGWGEMRGKTYYSTTLLYLEKTILPLEKCNERLNETGFVAKDYNVCLASESNFGMCYGDSGSPLTLKENGQSYAVGVVSWGIPCAKGYPDVFTRVSSHLDWILKTVGEDLEQ